jgi:hypothetical protein
VQMRFRLAFGFLSRICPRLAGRDNTKTLPLAGGERCAVGHVLCVAADSQLVGVVSYR